MSALTHPLGVSTSSRERLVFAIAIGGLGTLGFSVTAPLLPDLADALEVSRSAIGWVQAAVSVSSVALSMLIGYLADRFGRRRVVLTSLLIFAAFGTAGFWARSFTSLVAVRLAQGVGTSGILGLGIVLIGDVFDGEERRRAIGLNFAGITCVNMLGPIASGLISHAGVFRPFLLYLIGFPLALWATRLPGEQARRVEAPLAHAGEAVRFLRRGGNLVDFVGLLFATIGTTILLHGLGFTTVPLFLDGEFGVAASGRGLVIATFQVGVILAAIRFGSLRGRHTGVVLISLSFALMALGMLITAMAPEWWVVTLGLTVAGVGFGLFVPQAQDRSATVGGTLYRGLTVLTWVTFVRIGQVIGPPAGSWSSETLGPRLTFGVTAVVMIAASLSWMPIRRRLTKQSMAAD